MPPQPPPVAPRRSPALFPLALLAVTFGLFFAGLLAGDRALYFRDLQVFFEPLKRHLADAMRAGEIPWWNPRILGGSPFLANLESGVFYPPNVLFLLFPFRFSMNAFVVGHCAIAAAGMYALHRRRGASPLVATFPALVYTFGGVTLSMVNLLNNLQAAAWAPWVLFAWVGYCGKGRFRSLVATAFLLAVQFLGGAPVVLAITVGFVLLYGLLLRRVGLARYLLAFGWTGGLALLLSAFQLLPTLQLIGLSTRHHVAGGTPWSMDPGTLAGVLVPRLYFPDGGHAEIVRPLFERGAPWLLSLYVGPLVLALAVLALFVRRGRRETILGLAIAGGMALLSLGANFAPVRALLELGLFQNAFRVPEKFFWGSFLALALTSTTGFAALAERRTPRWLAPGMLAFLVAAALLPLALAARSTPGLVGLLAGSATIGAACCGLVVFHELGRVPPRMLSAGLLVLLALDLWQVNGRVNPTLPGTELERPSPIVELLPLGAEQFRVRTGRRVVGPGTTHGIPDDLPPAVLARLYRDGLVPNVGTAHGVSTFDGFEPMKTYKAAFFLNRIENARDPETLARLLGLVNVRYLLLGDRVESPALRPVATIEEWTVHEVVDALPRAFVRGRVRRVEPGAFPPLLFDGGVDLRREVLVPGGGPGERVLSEHDEPGRAEIVRYGASEVALRVRMDEPGCLVLLDANYPGWSVEVDGARAEVLPAYGLFRGVELDAGAHEVVFLYRERRFAAGLALSAVGLLLCVATLVVGRRRHAD